MSAGATLLCYHLLELILKNISVKMGLRTMPQIIFIQKTNVLFVGVIIIMAVEVGRQEVAVIVALLMAIWVLGGLMKHNGQAQPHRAAEILMK